MLLEPSYPELLPTWRGKLDSERLKVALISPHGRPWDTRNLAQSREILGSLLTEGDEIQVVEPAAAGQCDFAALWRPCGPSDTAKPLCELRVPVLPFEPPLCFHPFHAAVEREVEARGGILLPSHSPDEVRAGISALRAQKTLAGLRLLVVDDHVSDSRGEEIQAFGNRLYEKTGVEIIHLPTGELLGRAASISSDRVASEWRRLSHEGFEDRGELNQEHLAQVTRLYLALRALLEEHAACGVTVDDIKAFLLGQFKDEFPANVMPNVAYSALVDDGYLACEEGDIEVLATELLLAVASGHHPTMSNIYLAFRDEFEAHFGDYTGEREAADFEQCRRENILVAAHFSTSGVLPREMREEERVPIRETLPSWRGQSMVGGTPRRGPVRLARLSRDGSASHALPGDVVDVRMDESKGWYRGRWMIRIESVDEFIRHCQHQHYAIGPAGPPAAWETLVRLCGFDVIG